jgi:hypothetical protein
MEASGTTLWNTLNKDATNERDLSGLPGVIASKRVHSGTLTSMVTAGVIRSMMLLVLAPCHMNYSSSDIYEHFYY